MRLEALLRTHAPLALVLFAITVPSQASGTVTGKFLLDQQDVDVGGFLGDTGVDTYIFELTNKSADPVLALDLRFTGSLVDLSEHGPPIDELFRLVPEIPQLADFLIPDSFFISNGHQLVGASTEVEGVLAAAWLVAGYQEIVPAGGSAPVAYLALPTGEFLSNTEGVAVLGQGDDLHTTVEIAIVPEPSAFALACLGLVGVAWRWSTAASPASRCQSHSRIQPTSETGRQLTTS
ncbi:PEP-CTERM sorting domain-containing protein [Aeoliella sp.]|uniref:PEP-CTERM sorting domain-containing protein n=1 Tax=Aeoliella sp. TaxID=2795800 RepID=UPI003CCBAB48